MNPTSTPTLPSQDSHIGLNPLPADHSVDGKGSVKVGSMTMSVVRNPMADRFDEPVMTIRRAAKMLGVSSKRLSNVISEEKAVLGRLPDFVCDADGRMRRHIDRQGLLEWVKARRRKMGRPSKVMS